MNKEQLTIIKIGGNVIDHQDSLNNFIADFSAIKGNKILVHGGGKLATALSDKLGVKAKMTEGRRITDEETLKVVTMVYAGWINKTVVANLQKNRCNAIGLSGADANCIRSEKRIKADIDYGFVGDLTVDSVNVEFFKTQLGAGLVPVICPITCSSDGILLNTNADTIASALAVALAAAYKVRLIFCFDKKGVLKNINDDNSLIEKIDSAYYFQLKKDKIIFEGMLPKLDNAFKALENGVSSVSIGLAGSLNDIILNNKNACTTLVG